MFVNVRYEGDKTNAISFPLGGIGTGCIGLAGNGRLIDWEIYNRPNKGSFNGFSHFAVKAEQNGKLIDARILNGDLHPPYSGQYTPTISRGFGFGPQRQNLAGMPHFRKHEFIGQYPFAKINFSGEKLPGQNGMRRCERAWTPVATCKRQGRNIFDFIHEAVIAHWTNQQSPTLLC